MRRVLAISMMSVWALAVLAGCASQPCQKDLSPRIPDVTTLTNRDYFPMVHQIFQTAEDSIRVMMFSARYYTEKPRFTGEIEHEPGTHWSNTNILLDDLVDASNRGVDVQIILDSSTWNESNTDLNEDFGWLLVQGGVSVFMDDPEVTTHTKLILVDADITVVGSTNWSYYALDSNNETSVLIRSRVINGDYQEFFREILSSSTPLDVSGGE